MKAAKLSQMMRRLLPMTTVPMLNESVNFVAAAWLSRYASIAAGPYSGSILTAV
jgi:hypothetical protein